MACQQPDPKWQSYKAPPPIAGRAPRPEASHKYKRLGKAHTPAFPLFLHKEKAATIAA